MWFLVPVIVGGGILLLKNLKKEKEESLELNAEDITEDSSFKIEYRRIYICHSYYDSKSYNKLIKKLKLKKDYKLYNHSIPIGKKRDTTDKNELSSIFRQQMSGCTHVFVLATPKIPKQSFIKAELEIAKDLGKKIIIVSNKEHIYSIPPFIKKMSKTIVINDARTLKKQLK